MKFIFTAILFLSFTVHAVVQRAGNDTLVNKEPVSIGELGAAVSKDIKGVSTFGYNIAVEVTPIDDWLELELGASPTFTAHVKEPILTFYSRNPGHYHAKLSLCLGSVSGGTIPIKMVR